ncbi:THUMP-like domain-containing protein [Capnocytophaga sp. G2]|uniref:THUMP-like domain-containing protein n=1 Tax=Capnocytophaga sp. G2 TaxID=3110695 RepID=UPI002B464852|nr:hypothetical protein [Capnocytophaga sp. G2]MEB3005161.1 hypothetical protein [Capnocytophaga sp. G2]
MLNYRILDSDVQAFIQRNLKVNIPNLILKKSPFEGITSAELATQIEGKARSRTKLPLWYATEGIYYPAKLSLEQASSEATACYKASLVSGNLLDATGGFGVDDYFFSQRCKSVTHCELQKELSEIVQHNFKLLQAKIHCVSEDSYKYLYDKGFFFDVIYLDPSRRDNQKRRIFLLEDCLPNVPDTLDFLWQYTDTLLIKTSPMLDITQALIQLPQTAQVHIVAVENEVKELLFLLKKERTNTLVRMVNMCAYRSDIFSFYLSQKQKAVVGFYGTEGKYLYEPNASILKGGATDLLAQEYGLMKVAPDSHLLIGENYLPDFQGRIFRIKEKIPFSKTMVRQSAISQANITIRNFPLSVEQIRKQFHIKEGGNLYLFFTTTSEAERIVIICEKPFG